MAQTDSSILDTFLQQVLSQYDAQQKTITLGGNINADVAALLAYAQTTSVPLSTAEVVSTSSQLTVSGYGAMDKLGGEQAVVLLGSVVDNQLALTLTAEPQQTLDLSTVFPGLAETPTANDAGLIVNEPSLFYALDYQQPEWLITNQETVEGVIYPAQGLNLKADIDISDKFPHVAVLTGRETVTFNGPVSFPADALTQLYLDALFPGFSMSVGSMRMHDFHLVIRTVYYDDEPEYNFTGNLFTGVLDISSDVQARIGVDTQQVPPSNKSSSIWTFYSDFGPGGLSLNAGLQALAGFVGGDAANFDMPESVRDLGSFGLTTVVLGVNPYRPTDIEFVFLEVGSPKVWEPPIPYIAVENLHVQWQILRPFDFESPVRQESGGVGGTLTFGKTNPVHLDVFATIPEFIINANMRQGDEISVVDALSEYFPDAGGLSQDLVIDDLNIVANFDSKVYEFQGSVRPEPPFTIDLVITKLTLKRVSLNVSYSQDQLYGTVLAVLRLFESDWEVSAAYSGPGPNSGNPDVSEGNWTFLVRQPSGEQVPLSELVSDFLNFDPAYIPTVNLEGLYFQYNLADKTYTFKGKIKGYWTLDIIPGSPAIQAEAETSLSSFIQESETQYKGYINGKFGVNDLLVGVGYAFDPTNTNYSFAIEYKKLALYATLTRTTKKQEGQDVVVSVLRIAFGDLSLGEIIEYLVNLANPYADFTLESPWDVLNALTLKNLSLVIDLTNNTVGIEYRFDLELIFVYIESVNLTYLEKSNGKGTVEIGIKGRFLAQDFGEEGEDELRWDLLNDPAPEVPGKGNNIFSLKYLGIGQHVSLSNATSFNSVSEVINALKQDMLPVANPNENPLSQPAQHNLVFDQDSHWLFGVQFVVLDGIGVSAVFNDPYLYGLLIDLAGDSAGSLKGLQFELLYKRITDNLGVFKVVLQVPEAFRQLEFGEVSVTLPVIKVDVYTNGNFMVDLGFPENDNFNDSFGLQVFPFIGKGGLYFAYLIGETAMHVPRVTNGQMSPVIELGIGLAVGVGKEINKGVLNAGLSLTVQAIVEGSLAWFHAYNRSQEVDMYFWAQGTAAIVGKLYGAVDFKVIKVSVSVTARASVTLTIECYQPILVQLTVEVSVQASVKVLFVRIHFSFGLDLDLSFEIGSASPTPWIVDASAAAPSGARQLTQNSRLPGGRRHGVARRAVSISQRLYWHTPLMRVKALHVPGRRMTAVRTRLRAEHFPSDLLFNLKLVREEVAPTPTFNWTPRQVFTLLQSLPVLVMPALTVAQNEDLLPADRGSGATSNQVPLTFVIENGMNPSAHNLPGLDRVSAEHSHTTSDVMTLPFNSVVRGVLAWSIASFIHDPDILDGDIDRFELEALSAALDKTDSEGDGFTTDQLQGFLDLNYLFRIGAYTGDSDKVTDTSVTFMPVPPPLSMQLPGQETIDFSEYRQVGAVYEDTVAAYFAEMEVNYGVDAASDPFAVHTVTPANSDTESMAQMIQRDYFMMLARSAAQAALQLMEALPYPVSDHDSLQDIVDDFPRIEMRHTVHAGETAQTLETTYDMTLAQLQQLNPGVDFSSPLPAGVEINVLEGPTVVALVQSNRDRQGLLRAQAVVPISGAAYQVNEGEALDGIARQLGVNLDQMLEKNADSTQLLKTGVSFQLPAFTYTSIEGDTLDFVAAYLLVRNGSEPAEASQAWYSLDQYPWYEQAIAVLNSEGDSYVDFGKVIPVNTLVKVPPSYLESDADNAVTYHTREGDTLDRIAGYFLLLQNPTEGYRQFRDSLQVSGGTTPQPQAPLPVSTVVNVPAWAHRIQVIDSLQRLTQALGLSPVTIQTSDSLSDPAILNELAVLALPDLNYTLPDDEQTFATLAAYFNMDLEALAASLAPTTGYFNDTILTVPNIARLSVQSLLDALLLQSVNEIARSASRFMMHGLRLPLPPENPQDPVDTSVLYGMYELVGQQVPIDNFTLPLDITLTTTDAPVPPTHPGGIEFFDTYAVTAEDTYESLLQQYPNFPEYNPGITPEKIKAGLLLYVELKPQLTISIDQAYVDANQASPSLTLSWEGDPPPIRPMTLGESNPMRYSLPRAVHWQASQTPPYAGQTADAGASPGEPSILMFPKNLLGKLRDEAWAGHDYALMLGDVDDKGKMKFSHLSLYDWATTVEIRVKRLPKSVSGLEKISAPQEKLNTDPSGFMPTTYEVLPANNDSQSLLLMLWSHIKNDASEASAIVKILYTPSQQSDNPNGVQSLVENAELTYVLKSNLSTLSTSGTTTETVSARLAKEVEILPVSAAIDEPGHFLQLLWESSVVGNGGYFLNYVAADKGLPEGLFDNDNVATLKLLVMLPSQTRASDPVRAFYAFNNCAVLGDNIAIDNANVFVQRSDGSETVTAATVPPGVYGFDGTRNNPGSNPPEDEVDLWRTQTLYSLIGYRTAGTGGFKQSNHALPIGPAVPPAQQQQFREATEDTDYPWYYQHSVPAYELVSTYRLPSSPYLPSPSQDPYAGIAAKSKISVDFSVHDLYGNRLTPSNPIPQVDLDVLYTDELIALSSWPGTTTGYRFSGVQNPDTKQFDKAAVDISLAFQTANYVPGAGTSFSRARYNTSAHQLKYSQVYYQISQQGLDFSLTTSLMRNPAEASGSYPLDLTVLRQYVQAVYIFLSAASCIQLAQKTVDNDSTSFDTITTEYPVTVEGLGEANADVSLKTLFTQVHIPAYQVFPQQGTLAQVAQSVGISAGALAAQNTDVPLSEGVVLIDTPSRSISTQAPAALVKIAGANRVTVDNIAIVNAGTPGLLVKNIPVSVDNVTLLVEENDTFSHLVTRFADKGVDTNVETIATANENTPGLIAGNVTLVVDDYVIRSGDTFKKLAAQYPDWSAESLGEASKGVANVFTPGVSVYLGIGSLVTPGAQDTFSYYGLVYNLTVAQLTRANAGQVLISGATLQLPGIADVEDSGADPMSVPYSIPASTDWNSIVASVGQTDTQAALMKSNQYTPDLLNADVTIRIGDDETVTGTDSTFYSVLQSLNSGGATHSYADLAAAIGAMPDLMKIWGALAVPLPTLPDKPLQDVASQFNVMPQSLAVANAAISGLIQSGQSVTVQGHTIKTEAGDTFATLVQRFLTEQGVVVSVEDIATAVATSDGFLIPDAKVLLPPKVTALDVTLYTSLPVKPPYPGVIFELNNSITLSRPEDTIHPDFSTEPKVRAFTSVIAPQLETDANGNYLLTDFAEQVELIFDGLKVAVGRDQITATDKQVQHLYCVNFTSAGISNIDIHADAPAVFAIKPIANKRMSARDIAIQPLQEDGTLGTAESKDFDGVDMDVWARQLLASIDLFLSAELAAPAYELDKDSYDSVVGVKSSLAGTIVNGLAAVTSGTDSSGLSLAQERLKQALLFNLTEAYETAALLQYPSTTDSPADTDANLSGKPVAVLKSDNPGETEGVFTLTVDAATTFESMEAFFGVSMQTIVDQIKTQHPLLAPQGVFSYPDQAPYTVPDADTTLQDVADHFGLDDPTPVAEYNRTVSGLFSDGIVVSIAMQVPDFTVSSGKTSLANGNGYVNFMLTVPKEQRHKTLLLNLDYQLNEIEYAIRPVPGSGGFNSSSWLSFVIPITAKDHPDALASTLLGQADVPLPLRSVPELPVLAQQYFEPTVQDLPATFPENLQKAKEWSYFFSWEQNAAAQDSTFITVYLNQAMTVGPRPDQGLARLRTLFAKFAQFNSVYPQLKSCLLSLQDPVQVSANSDKLKNCINTFNTLISEVADAWHDYWQPVQVVRAAYEGLEPIQLEFEAMPIVDPLISPPVLRSLILKAQNAQGYDFEQYPVISYFDTKAKAYQTLMKRPTTDHLEVVYDYPPDVLAFEAILQRYEFGHLDAVSRQNAWGELVVRRNLELLPGKQTAEAFIYETPAITFTNPVYPAIVREDIINVRTSADETLHEALAQIFSNLLGDNPELYSIQVTVRYGYELAVPADASAKQVLSDKSIISEIPVLFRSKTNFDSHYEQQLETALNNWLSYHQPEQVGGVYVFDITVYSVLDSELLQPVINLERIVFPLS